MIADVNPFEEEMGWKGIVGADVRPVQATVLRVAVVCLSTRLHYPSNQLQAAPALVPMPADPPSLLHRLAACPT